MTNLKTAKYAKYLGKYDDTLIPMKSKDWNNPSVREYILSLIPSKKAGEEEIVAAYKEGYESK